MKLYQIIANQEGQKIFTITKDNYQEIIPKLNLAPAAIADIESAAKAGYTVTTHQNRISLNGYTGEGYIILNDSGVGAWMINGGMYGAALVMAIGSAMFLSLALWGYSTPLGRYVMGRTGFTELIRASVALKATAIALVTRQKAACEISWRLAQIHAYTALSKIFRGLIPGNWINALYAFVGYSPVNPCDYIKEN